MRNITDFLDDEPEGGTSSMGIAREILTLAGSVASRTSNKRIDSIITWTSAAISVGAVAKSAFDLYRRHNAPQDYIIKISEDDDIFDIAEKWLNDSLPEDKQRSVFLRSNSKVKRKNSSSYDDPIGYPGSGRKPEVEFKIHFDGTVSQIVDVEGHKVTIFTSVPEQFAGASERGSTSMMSRSRTITFMCPSIEARNAVTDKLKRETRKLSATTPKFHVCNKWGGFHRNSDVPRRPLETVVLKEGQKERIMAYLRRFLDSEQDYVKLGIPFRTGILLYGNPGSGKSSTAATIAYELGMDIYYVSLSSLDGDDELAQALNNVPSNSIVILEDIDTYHGATDRDNDEGVTMQGLLNCLDGFVAPHGVITIMTTNRLDVLDPAIVRPGRVDLREELNELDDYQLRGILKQFTGHVPENLPVITPDDKITSAKIVGLIKNHIPHVENATEDILTLLRETRAKKTKDFTKV
jgi:predicted AAA+ superfamily ATPase